MDLGPRHDLSHLSSERFHWTSRAGGRSKAVRRSSAWLGHQDRIHECSAERRLLCSTTAVRRTVQIHAVRSHRSSHLERRFSACRLMANVLVSWQSKPTIHLYGRRSAPTLEELSAPSTQQWQAPGVGARPFEVTNTSSDLVSARLRPSDGLFLTKDWLDDVSVRLRLDSNAVAGVPR